MYKNNLYSRLGRGFSMTVPQPIDETKPQLSNTQNEPLSFTQIEPKKIIIPTKHKPNVDPIARLRKISIKSKKIKINN